MLLLLTFFVMMFAMSSVKNERWREFSASLAGALRPITAFDPRPFPRPFAPSDAGAGKRDVDYMAALLANTVASERDLAGYIAVRGAEGLVLRPPVAAWEGDALSARGRAGAAALAERLRLVDNEVVVRVRTGPQSADWARAMGRGLALAQALRGAAYPRDVAVLGAGDMGSSDSGAVEIVLRPARAGAR